eukprot:4647325-Prymnesium_polylepis.1
MLCALACALSATVSEQPAQQRARISKLHAGEAARHRAAQPASSRGAGESLSIDERDCVPSAWSESAHTERRCESWMRRSHGMRWSAIAAIAPPLRLVYGGTALWRDPSTPVPHVDAVVLRPLQSTLRSKHHMLFVYASCGSTDFDLDVHRSNIGSVRLHYPTATIIMVSCGEQSLPKDIRMLPDAVLRARCAASRGYDSGMWQQGIRYALKVISWATLRAVYLINDSVLGPLFRMKPAHGLSVPAVWRANGVSSAVQAYTGPVVHDAVFIDFWNRTNFVCNKIGSMNLLERALYARYREHGTACSTYTNDIREFQSPNDTSVQHPLPFYKLRNNGWLPAVHAAGGRAALEDFGRRIAAANRASSSSLEPCEAAHPWDVLAEARVVENTCLSWYCAIPILPSTDVSFLFVFGCFWAGALCALSIGVVWAMWKY